MWGRGRQQRVTTNNSLMIQLYNQDCMEALKLMKDNQFDLAIVDPPYGWGEVANFTPKRKGGRRTQTHKAKGWNDSPPPQEYFEELFRVSENQIIWGANYFQNLPVSRGWIFWDKLYENTHNFSDGELAYTSFDRVLKMVRMSQRWIPNTPKNIHPTQKPVKLYEWLLSNYAKEGDTILDTHLGSGSIALACHNLGFDLTGYEIDKDYFEGAKARLEAHQRQTILF